MSSSDVCGWQLSDFAHPGTSEASVLCSGHLDGWAVAALICSGLFPSLVHSPAWQTPPVSCSGCPVGHLHIFCFVSQALFSPPVGWKFPKRGSPCASLSGWSKCFAHNSRSVWGPYRECVPRRTSGRSVCHFGDSHCRLCWSECRGTANAATGATDPCRMLLIHHSTPCCVRLWPQNRSLRSAPGCHSPSIQGDR